MNSTSTMHKNGAQSVRRRRQGKEISRRERSRSELRRAHRRCEVKNNSFLRLTQHWRGDPDATADFYALLRSTLPYLLAILALTTLGACDIDYVDAPGNCNCPISADCNQGNCTCKDPDRILCGGYMVDQDIGGSYWRGYSCVDPQSDSSNCGRCNNSCSDGTICIEGRCQCPAGQVSCITENNYGYAEDSACVDTHTDPMHCGVCNFQCPESAACVNGSCQCPEPSVVCPTPCEGNQQNCYACDDFGYPASSYCQDECVLLEDDSDNCGTCGHQCADQAECTKGNCACTSTALHCTRPCSAENGDCFDCDLGRCENYCIEPNSNAACGSCENICPLGTLCQEGTCSTCQEPDQSACEYLSPYPDENSVPCSDPLKGEYCLQQCVPLESTLEHCGACNRACPYDSECIAGDCTCPQGTELCAQSCLHNERCFDCEAGRCELFCLDTTSDNTNCGACNHRCPQLASCSEGECACPSYATDICEFTLDYATEFTHPCEDNPSLHCFSSCVDLKTEEAACGSCDHACASGESCIEGSCQ